ncbi:DUF6786 family protein [Agriterribacter sp.]|uniref:DUF6786 family protein n=1 Tax=Agriterribacter sp. TaxID=2821509 RepID=UPI002C6ED858|nr:DUF6786 family protein [Agriterribacter sp.]HRP56324.1 hypothetical protein [Agriterribacter sp.]
MNKYFSSLWSISFLIIVLMSCNESQPEKAVEYAKGSYGYDAAFLKEHLDNTIELWNEAGARVLLTADYQGRVMTSTASGDSGNSAGWINYDLVASGKFKDQFNPVGGEERLWIGPEGGQYSFYFKKGDSFHIKNWQVPPIIDTVAYQVTHSDSTSVEFSQKAVVTNYSGAQFNIFINRNVRLLDEAALNSRLQTNVPGDVQWVAYETENIIKNMGENAWKKESGLLSIWLLGMFTPSEETVAIVPFRNRKDVKNFITDNYFGQIPFDRLTMKDSVLLLKCDGKHRSKLGLSPMIAKPLAGSFDFKRNMLTVIFFDIDPDGDYVNSKWELQKQPYKGDVVNAYNDGPLEDGSQLGPFYELESSSAAKPLQPGETQIYRQATCHFEGDYTVLKALAQQLLGIDLDSAKMR